MICEEKHIISTNSWYSSSNPIYKLVKHALSPFPRTPKPRRCRLVGVVLVVTYTKLVIDFGNRIKDPYGDGSSSFGRNRW